ncbi:MAG: hypothetical protein SFV15_16760 [Polyangiaceae bacterium]|nr:hypothetical protein [Polyangiaceae bacterium]
MSRQLRDLPGYEEARRELEKILTCKTKRELDNPGLWVPPQSIDCVTVSLLRGLTIGVTSHRCQLREAKALESRVVQLSDYRPHSFGRPIDIARMRARGDFGYTSFGGLLPSVTDPKCGGDPRFGGRVPL